MEIKRWNGLRSTTTDERFKPGDLAAAADVEIDDTGKLMSRRGLAVVSAVAAHSLYANHVLALLVEDGHLRAVEPDFSRTTVVPLVSGRPMSYDTAGDLTFYSNGTDLGRLVGRSHGQWGVTPPVGQPQASQDVGSLPQGRYLYAMTFLRSDGHESGTGLAGAIDLAGSGGIFFTGLEASTNPEVTGKILYLSSPNGEVMYRALALPNAATETWYAGSGLDLTVPLRTQFAGPPPPGSIVRYYNGCMYVVCGDVVYYSDPYDLELFRQETNYLRFPGQVAMFECVNDGIYVATADVRGDDAETSGKTWYLAGARPDQMKSVQVFNHGAVPGTAAKTAAAFFDTRTEDAGGAIEPGRPAVVWMSRNGICVGFDGGAVRNLTDSRYNMPFSKQGAGVVLESSRGHTQYIAVLR